MRVFVYGTLKKGYGNHRLLENSKYIGPAVSMDKFMMIGGGFPVIFKDDSGNRVIGEVYEINPRTTLEALDNLEGEGSMYDRKEVSVQLLDSDGAEFQTASIYIGNTKFWGVREPQNSKWLNEQNCLDWNRE